MNEPNTLAEDFLKLAGRLLLAGLFSWSGWIHVQDPIVFQIKVNEYNILPPAWEGMFAQVLPWVMLAAAGLLVLGLLTRAGSGALGLCLISFLIAVGVNLYRQRVLGCGCFSEEGSQIGWGLMAQDLGLFLVALYLIWKGGGRISLDRLIGKTFWKR